MCAYRIVLYYPPIILVVGVGMTLTGSHPTHFQPPTLKFDRIENFYWSEIHSSILHLRIFFLERQHNTNKCQRRRTYRAVQAVCDGNWCLYHKLQQSMNSNTTTAGTYTVSAFPDFWYDLFQFLNLNWGMPWSLFEAFFNLDLLAVSSFAWGWGVLFGIHHTKVVL